MKQVILFDADDTLWDCQTYYDKAEERFNAIMARFGTAAKRSEQLFEIEARNMPDYGFGAKAVALSMIEAAIKIGGRTILPEEIGAVLKNARDLLHLPCTPLPGVEETLKTLRNSGRYKLILLTKGDLLDQENKLKRSGLKEYFDRVVILSDKGEEQYLQICKEEGLKPEDMVMVGNSFKSDIKPVIELGGTGIFIPFKVMWKYETLEEYDHPNIHKFEAFSQILKFFEI